ncbi:hypothetical protein [Phaeobacter piscinae]|uniref:DUF4440 domain-containing protein n=1 Tax=Phaeobacter piscinae TaxID=1580596 RepID=A0AAN1LCF9_9RHOB|nr:hypothetical protein [Phaeobacter piscinae]ATG45632.1 hypothetical protein PhaeoP13_03750 [Phaeobacter piscinae]AUQ76561.1 hypothetical protein PhaeoP71_03740 [Phaeobacter piscinae]
MNTLEIVTKEVVDLHDFFTEWFNGTVERDQLDPQFLSRLDKNVTFIPPEGHIMTGDMLRGGFDRGYGANKDFRTKIRDVTIRHEVGDLVMATYTEWQTGAALSAEKNNARVTSVVVKMSNPVTWLHIHETWLPDTVRDAGAFDF